MTEVDELKNRLVLLEMIVNADPLRALVLALKETNYYLAQIMTILYNAYKPDEEDSEDADEGPSNSKEMDKPRIPDSPETPQRFVA